MKQHNSILFLLLSFAVGSEIHAGTAEDLVNSSGIRGGLVVHVGCADGTLTAALHVNESYLIQGLDTNKENVDAAREHIQSEHLYGRVSVRRFDGKTLPYVDNLVNLVVISEPDNQILDSEIMRVLAPRGVAIIGGRKLVKPWPDEIDEWSHYLNGSDNNAVADDTVIDTPRRLKWSCGPLWSRTHEHTSSISVLISAEGRLLYVVDEGLTGRPDLPERWVLIARDAFNGVVLWRKPLKEWGQRLWRSTALRGTPRSIPSRLVAGGGKLFMIKGTASKVVAYDAATGAFLKEYKGTDGSTAMRYSDGVLVVHGKGLTAFDAELGMKIWEKEGSTQPLPAVSDGQVYFNAGADLICVGLKDGKERWKKTEIQKIKSLLVDRNNLAVFASPFHMLGATTGETMWTGKVEPGFKHSIPLIANGKLWVGWGGYDLTTGHKVSINADDVYSLGHHTRCYPCKATTKYMITANRGVEFVNLTGKPNSQNDWMRGSCSFGVLPCNGLLYVPPNPCFCYTGVKIAGFNAYMGNRPFLPNTREPLTRGPAYGKATGSELSTGDWGTYRGNARRSGSSSGTVDTDMQISWSIKLAGRLTQPVIADGRVLVVSKDTHTLHVLNARSGEETWAYTAGARIDSPPTVYGDLVLFGCVDGNVYCLRAGDGELVWKFRAAPSSRQIIAFNQLESPWRVHGSVLIEKGVAYSTSGRSTMLDGGILVYGLEPATGKILHKTELYTWSRTRTDTANKPYIPSYHMEGAFSDILTSEGGHIYLGQYQLNLELQEQDVPYIGFGPQLTEGAMGKDELIDKPYTEAVGARKEGDIKNSYLYKTWPKLVQEYKDKYGGRNMGQRQFGRHIFATSGFLDDAYFDRTCWMSSETWPGFTFANRASKAGQLIAVGEKNTYAIQAFPARAKQSPSFGRKAYLLLADDNDNEAVMPAYTRGITKGIGFTRKDPPVWFQWIDLRVRAMVSADNSLLIAGTPDVIHNDGPMASLDGRTGASLRAVSKKTGKKMSGITLDSPPVFDGMAAAEGRIYISLTSGRIICVK